MQFEGKSLPGRATFQHPSPSKRRDGGRTGFDHRSHQPGGFGTQLLTVLLSQVLRDYLQGKLVVSTLEEAQLARLAALQHLSKAQEGPPSE